MLETIGLIGIISRAEFLLPNLGSLIMGLAWGVTPALDLTSLVVLLALSFAIINLSSAIGAQINTLSDYELDSKDNRKKRLVQALDSFGRNRLKGLMVAELLFTLALVSLFMLIQGKPILLLMWVFGISLGWMYSAPPLRLKSRSWLAPAALILVLAVFPVLFAYYAFTSEMNPFFLLSLTGLALTVYAVIIPTEIRDYFGDRAMNIQTMTVHLGLVKASLLSIALLAMGAMLTTIAFVLEFVHGQHPLLSVLLLAIPVAAIIVLGKFRKLYLLSKEYAHSKEQGSIEEEIVSLSAHNPQWIMLITQTYSLLSIILLASKFLL
ncbi:MAG: prenyltransferase [Candidatus Bathyarchaeia archaeon]